MTNKGATVEKQVAEPATGQIINIKGHKALRTRLTENDYARNSWMLTTESGVPYEAVLKSSYWVHIAYRLKQWDRVYVRAEDGAFYAELLVVMASKTDAVVTELLHKELAAVKMPDDEIQVDGYTVRFLGVNRKWTVIRNEDKTVLREGLQSSAHATRWAQDHKKALG